MLKDSWGSDFRLVLIGEGPQRSELEKRADKLGIRDEVCFAGKIPNQEIKNYCHASDLFLFPSLSETQGIVLLESMAAGTPVLTLRATGTQDVVLNGENGYMTDMSEKEFASKLIDILEKKEIDLLRQGALETARCYSSVQIAKEAVLFYAQAVYNRKEKQQQKHGNGNRKKDMVYLG